MEAPPSPPGLRLQDDHLKLKKLSQETKIQAWPSNEDVRRWILRWKRWCVCKSTNLDWIKKKLQYCRWIQRRISVTLRIVVIAPRLIIQQWARNVLFVSAVQTFVEVGETIFAKQWSHCVEFDEDFNIHLQNTQLRFSYAKLTGPAGPQDLWRDLRRLKVIDYS